MTSGSTLAQVSQQAWAKRALDLIFCAGGIIVCYGAFSIFQEKITQKTYGENGDKFIFMQALVFFQCASNLALAWTVRSKNGSSSLDNVPTYLYSMCSVSYFLAMLFSNMALEWINYPTQVLGKSCKPIPIMLFGVIFAHKRYALRKYFYVLLIVMGMAIFLYKPGKGGGSSAFQFSRGELLLCASLAMDGITGAVQDRIRNSYTTDKWTMMFAMNAFSTVFLTIMLIASGELVTFFAFIASYPFVLREVILFAVAGAFGQYFIFKTVTDFGPLTCSIVTTLRKLFSLVFSILLFSHPYTNRHVIGTALVFTALMFDALDSRRSHNHSQKKLNGYATVPTGEEKKLKA